MRFALVGLMVLAGCATSRSASTAGEPADPPPRTGPEPVYVRGPPGPKVDLEQSDIMETVLENKQKLVDCVGLQREADPEAHGRVRMSWAINPDGTTSNIANVTPEYAELVFVQCLTDLVAAMEFPKTVNGTDEVMFPFTF